MDDRQAANGVAKMGTGQESGASLVTERIFLAAGSMNN